MVDSSLDIQNLINQTVAGSTEATKRYTDALQDKRNLPTVDTSKMQALQGQEEKLISQMPTSFPKAPQLQPFEEKAPTPTEVNPFDVFKQLGPAMLVLGSGFSRRSANGAIISAAQMMKGYQEGNKEKYEQARQKWLDDYKQYIDQQKLVQDQYDMAVKESKGNIDVLAAKVGAIASAVGDEYKLASIKSGNKQALLDNLQKGAEIYGKNIDNYTKILRYSNFGGVAADWQNAKDTDVVPGTGLTVGAIKIYGDAIISGAKPSTLGLGYGMNPVKKAVDNYIAYKKPDFDMAKAELGYYGQQREEGALATRSAPARIAVREMDTLGKPMISAIEKLDPSQFPNLNSVENAFQNKTGGPDIVKAHLAVQEFKTAFTNLMVRNGVPTDSARAKADDLINTNMSLSQIKGVVEQAKISGGAVIDALSMAQKDISGGSFGGEPEHKKGDIITMNGKKYRALEDGDDPEVELVQ